MQLNCSSWLAAPECFHSYNCVNISQLSHMRCPSLCWMSYAPLVLSAISTDFVLTAQRNTWTTFLRLQLTSNMLFNVEFSVFNFQLLGFLYVRVGGCGNTQVCSRQRQPPASHTMNTWQTHDACTANMTDMTSTKQTHDKYGTRQTHETHDNHDTCDECMTLMTIMTGMATTRYTWHTWQVRDTWQMWHTRQVLGWVLASSTIQPLKGATTFPLVFWLQKQCCWFFLDFHSAHN